MGDALAMVRTLASNRVTGLLLFLLSGDEGKLAKRKQVQAFMKQIAAEKLRVRECIVAQGKKAMTLS